MAGTDAATFTREAPGMSAFAFEDGVVYHTYSAYARGLDGLWGMYQWLDRAPKGRNEPDGVVAAARRVLGQCGAHARGGPRRTRSRIASSGPRNQPSASTHQVSPARS